MTALSESLSKAFASVARGIADADRARPSAKAIRFISFESRYGDIPGGLRVPFLAWSLRLLKNQKFQAILLVKRE
jgi:hypothetical protein